MNEGATDLISLARIEKAFRRVFGSRVAFGEAVTRETEPRWTSLKHVEFLIALEQEFGVRFDGADATDVISIRVVRERLAARLAEPR